MKQDLLYTYLLPTMAVTSICVAFFGTLGLLGGSMFANAGFAVDPVTLSRNMGLGSGGLALIACAVISCYSYFFSRDTKGDAPASFPPTL